MSQNQNLAYSLIVRSNDGLPLSALTELEEFENMNSKNYRKYVKHISKKALQFPERCLLRLDSYNVYLITQLGVSFFVVCSSSYPKVLAFSFLNELMKEFISTYASAQIKNVVRPYSFIEFETYIQKTYQRYNKPQSLTTRINLSDLSLEMKLRPPHEIKLEDINFPTNGKVPNKLPYTVAHRLKFDDLSAWAFVVLTMCTMQISVSLFRGVSILTEPSHEMAQNNMKLHGSAFLFESLLRILQIYMMQHKLKRHKLKSWLILFALSIMCWTMRGFFNNWQMAFILFTTIFAHLSIINRRFQNKLPDYDV